MNNTLDKLEQWETGEEKPMAVETIAEFERIIDESFQLNDEIDAITKERIMPLQQRLKDLDMKILATLQVHNKTSYRSKAGMVVKTEKFSVKFPKDPANKKLVKDYMGPDKYEDMTTINYNSFNAWYKTKLEEAKELGDLTFQVPGCEPPTYVEYLQRRK